MNKILIDSDISYWGFSARWLSSKLADMTGDLEVDISSYGGDVFEGIDMFNQLRRYSKDKGHVTTIGGSKVMSIASLLLLAGDTRKAHSNSTIMIHKAWTWLAGNSDELLAESKILDGIDIILAKQYGKHMSDSQEEIMKIMSAEGWYIGQEQIENTNFIDEFIVEDGEVEVSAKANYKKAMARFSAKAQEDNVKPNFDEVKASIVECNDGKCPSNNSETNNLVENPASAKEDNVQGEQMSVKTYDEAAYKALEKTHAEDLEGINAKLETAVASLATAETDLEASDGLLKAANAKVDVTTAKNEVMPEIMAMAFKAGVDEKTLVKMATVNTLLEAKAAVVDGMDSDGAFGAQKEGFSADTKVVAKEDLKARCETLGVTFIGEK